MIRPRIDVTRAQIAQVVAAFYARVREDDVLGPVFAAQVTDWPSHEDKIVKFWANALLFERDYAGNPMQVHMAAGNVHSEHFPIWLSHFDDVLDVVLPRQQAIEWSRLAHRIGQGLSFGLDEFTRPHDVAPSLSA